MPDRSPAPTEQGERDWILHVDLDQFLAAVEVLRRPELAGRPVVVGGDGDPTRPRQVVATASYEARAFGVRSGMPLGTAARRCPDAVFLPSDRPAYEAASAEVMADAAVAPRGGRGVGLGRGVRRRAHRRPRGARPRTCRRRCRRATGCRCAVGIGETKLQAKTATGFAKPGGVARLTAPTWIADDGRPARSRRSGASATAPRGGSPSSASPPSPSSPRADHHELARRFGPTIGPYLRVLGLGGDDAPVGRRAARRPVAQPGGDVRARPHVDRRARRARRPPRDRGHRRRSSPRVAASRTSR